MAQTILKVTELEKRFKTSRGIVHAVDSVSFALAKGESIGVVGESGCGKSTLGKTVARLIRPTSGSIQFGDTDITTLTRRQLRPFRKQIQFIFQDPFASLNPRSRVRRILEEPLIVQGMLNGRERLERIHWLLERVGIPKSSLPNYPHEFSGGQRQRIGIARALILNPELIIFDEPVSALDVSVQAQVLNLLSDLQREFNFSSIFISHDFSVIKYISDRIIVMYLGRIMEISTPKDVWAEPLHPYTQALISAVPISDPSEVRQRKRIILHGDLPSSVNSPQGCPFNTRCPKAMKRCSRVPPQLTERKAGVFVACHLFCNE